MAAMTPELKARFKELGIFNSTWKGPNGKTYTVCRGGEFYMHTICETYVPRRFVMGKQKCKAQGLDPDEMVKYIEYKALRYHSSYGGGGYLYARLCYRYFYVMGYIADSNHHSVEYGDEILS